MIKKILIAVLLLSSILWAGKGIFKYNVFSTHDLDHHLARSYDAVKTFSEGHFPMRWAGSLNYNCGIPVYNFFYPLIYYLVILINSINPDVIMALKIIDFLSLLFGTIFFYFWIKEETLPSGRQAKSELPAIGGSLLYLYAPYRFSLIFVRGSPEFLAYAILPIVLYCYALFFNAEDKKLVKYAFLASLTGALLAISHNFTVMILFPIILVYLITKAIIEKIDLQKVYLLIFTYLGSFGLAAFFIGPALLEKKFTRIGENFLFWKEHFPTLGQLIRSPWGYFYSSLGTINDGMSFMLGYAHWVVLALAVIFLLYRMILKKKFDVWVILTSIASIVTIYLILPWSIPLWELVKPLQEIQFSWRLLGIAIFTISALFSFLLHKINSKIILIPIFVGVVTLAFIGNRNHMLPQPISSQDLYRYDDFEKYHFHRYSTTTLGDDIIAKGATEACWYDVPLIATDWEELKYEADRGNTYGFVKFTFPKIPKGKIITTGLGYFPGAYKFEINGKESSYNNCNGRVCFDFSSLHEGQNYLSWKIVQTPIESAFNYVSLTFIALWLVLLIGIKRIKPHLLLILIFALFMFFRSYNLPGRIGFGWDQERDANAVVQILSGNITLIGPRVMGPTGFFLPPYYFYLLTSFYNALSQSAYATVVFIIASAIVSFSIGYFVLNKIFNKKTALVALSLWAVNPLAVSIDTIAWNPLLIPTFCFLLIYSISLFYKKAEDKYLILSGLIFGLGMSFHTQFLFMFPIFIPLVFEIIKSKKFKQITKLLISSAVPFVPILVFDVRHNFLNFKQLVAFTHETAQINRIIPVWQRFSSFMGGVESSRLFSITIFTLILLGFIIQAGKAKDIVISKILKGLALTWGFSPVLFYIFTKNPSEYYFNYLLVPVAILFGYTLSKLDKIGFIITAFLISYFVVNAKPLLRNVNLSLRDKSRAVEYLSHITKNSKPFNISFDVPLNEDAGFRYLLDYYKIKYSNDPKDPLIEFVIPHYKRPVTLTFGQIGLYLPEGYLKANIVR